MYKIVSKIFKTIITFFICFPQINWIHILKLTTQTTFPNGLEPIALFYSPFSIPIAFFLHTIQQYHNIMVINALKKLNKITDEILKNHEQ
jgi:hypothetical protein